jgi:hypothetical protein
MSRTRRSIPLHGNAVVPMASQPTEMAARNWMLRMMKYAGGTLGYQTLAPTAAKAGSNAKFYQQQLQKLLATAPQRTM